MLVIYTVDRSGPYYPFGYNIATIPSAQNKGWRLYTDRKG